MRYFIGCVVLLVTAAGCSTTEPVQQEQETEPSEQPVITETTIPSWYNPGVHSSSDSLSLYGYALASAKDSSRAAELSTQTALEYLRFEADRISENARQELTERPEGEENYSSPAFIIHLRNSISSLPLEAATIDLQHETSDKGVHYSYTKASISRTELVKFLGNQLNDNAFLEKIEISSQ